MSSFTCPKCAAPIIDTPGGQYTTFCEHYPKEKVNSEYAMGCMHGRPPGQACPHCLGINGKPVTEDIHNAVLAAYPQKAGKIDKQFLKDMLKDMHQGHVIEGTPVSCGKECSCKCYCNIKKYEVGEMLSTNCEHCRESSWRDMKNGNSDFSNFFHHATDEEKKEVMLKAAKEGWREQEKHAEPSDDTKPLFNPRHEDVFTQEVFDTLHKKSARTKEEQTFQSIDNCIFIGHNAGRDILDGEDLVIIGDNIRDLKPENNTDVLFIGNKIAIGRTVLGEECNLYDIVKRNIKIG